jgi:anti-sigma B factor antagonist
LGSDLREKSFFRNDMGSPVQLLPETEEAARRFAESAEIVRLGTAAGRAYNPRRSASTGVHGQVWMTMTITERRIGDVTLLRLGGRIVFGDGAAELRARLNDLLDEARLKFLLDLRDVTYIDSFGVGVIAAKYVSVCRKGGAMKLLRLSPRTHRVMNISGLLKIFQSFEDEEDALRSFAATV